MDKGYLEMTTKITHCRGCITFPRPVTLPVFLLTGEQRAAILAESETRQWNLERAFQERVGLLIYFKVHPMFDELRIDPRLDALAKRIGIPE